MRILQIGKYYHPERGGMETMLRNLAEGLTDAGDQVTVLCSASVAKGSTEEICGVKIRRVPQFGLFFSQPVDPTLPYEIARRASSADIVHVHTPNPLAEISSFLLDKKKPLVVSYHSDIVRQRSLARLYSPLLNTFLKRADRIVVATSNHIEMSPVLRGFERKCEVIPFGLDPILFKASNDIEQKSARLRENLGPFILFVGRLVSYKGTEHLIRAVASTGGRLAIVGDGPLRASLESLAESLGAAGRIHFAGLVEDQNEFSAYYHACECVVLPSISRNEAFGLVQLEAMAWSKPSIVSRLPTGITLVNEEGKTAFFVEPGSPEELARAIQDLLSNPARKLEMGRAARLRFDEFFTREKMVNAYRRLYSSLS